MRQQRPHRHGSTAMGKAMGRATGRAMRLAALLAIAATLSAIAFAQGSMSEMNDMSDPLAGTVVEALATSVPSVLPDRTLMFLRITMDPGVAIPFHHHPGSVIVVVQSGLFGTEFKEGEGVVTRYGQEAPETVIAGDDTTLHPGDTLSYEGAVHSMRNDGPGPLVLLVSALLDPAQPGFIFQTAP